jgi:hypothetical protein
LSYNTLSDYFWFISSTLNRLTSIVIKLRNEPSSKSLLELENMINHVSHLYSLSFLKFPAKYQLPCDINHSSIRQMKFKQCCRYFKSLECIAFSRSSLSIQCEILLINIIDQTNIINLINSMGNLRVLYMYHF